MDISDVKFVHKFMRPLSGEALNDSDYVKSAIFLGFCATIA